MNRVEEFLGEPDEKWKIYVYVDFNKKAALVDKSRVIEIIRRLEGILLNIDQKLTKISTIDELQDFWGKKFNGTISEN